MEMERIALSQRERDRLGVLHEVNQKHLTQVLAAQQGLSLVAGQSPIAGLVAGARIAVASEVSKRCPSRGASEELLWRCS